MGIRFFEDQKYFKLDAGNTSYIIAIVGDEKFLGHVYFGKKVPDEPLDIASLLRINEYPFTPSVNNRERISFNDTFPTEYSTHGLGDFRESCLVIRDSNGHSVCGITYSSHKIYRGKPALKGLPATFGDEDSCTTLEITCCDKVLDLEVTLVYTTFENLDVITRSVRVKNNSNKDIKLEKVLSACVDFDGIDYDMISLHGSWARKEEYKGCLWDSTKVG